MPLRPVERLSQVRLRLAGKPAPTERNCLLERHSSRLESPASRLLRL